MKQPIAALTLILSSLLTGCGTINSNVSCKAEAADSCLTIEQVDAMTRFADDVKPASSRGTKIRAENNRPNSPGKIIQQTKGKGVWVAQQVEGQSWA